MKSIPQDIKFLIPNAVMFSLYNIGQIESINNIMFKGVNEQGFFSLISNLVDDSTRSLEQLLFSLNIPKNTNPQLFTEECYPGVKKAIEICNVCKRNFSEYEISNLPIKINQPYSLEEVLQLGTIVNNELIRELIEYKEYIYDHLEYDEIDDAEKNTDPIFMQLPGIVKSIEILNNRLAPVKDFGLKLSSEEERYFGDTFKLLEIIPDNEELTFKSVDEKKLRDIQATLINQCAKTIHFWLDEHSEELDEWSISVRHCARLFSEHAYQKSHMSAIKPGQDFSYNDLKLFAKEAINYCSDLTKKDIQDVIDRSEDDEWCIGYGYIDQIIKKEFLFGKLKNKP